MSADQRACSKKSRIVTHTLMSHWIIVLPVLQELEELFCPPFLKQSHERALDSLHLCARHLGNPAIAVHKASGDLFELEVASYVGMNENFSEFPRSNDKLWNEIDRVIAVTTKFNRRALVWSKLAVQLGIDWQVLVTST
jgi:hypothetical protein